MELFSHRKGLKPLKTQIQVDGMDNDLRIGLWNALSFSYWRKVNLTVYGVYHGHDEAMTSLCEMLWISYFKRPVDNLPRHWKDVYGELRTYFFSCPWNEAYDFVEFVAQNFPQQSYEEDNARFMKACNSILEREVSGYRFVAGKIVEITTLEEVGEVEEAIQSSGPLKSIGIHLQKALDFLADRKAPDYRNSIKESISAVESACKILTQKPKADLNDALRELNKTVPVHPALEQAFSKLYAYTNDEKGIRHALLDEPNLEFDDAKFMLVCCAAFVNYLKSKAAKAR